VICVSTLRLGAESFLFPLSFFLLRRSFPTVLASLLSRCSVALVTCLSVGEKNVRFLACAPTPKSIPINLFLGQQKLTRTYNNMLRIARSDSSTTKFYRAERLIELLLNGNFFVLVQALKSGHFFLRLRACHITRLRHLECLSYLQMFGEVSPTSLVTLRVFVIFLNPSLYKFCYHMFGFGVFPQQMGGKAHVLYEWFDRFQGADDVWENACQGIHPEGVRGESRCCECRVCGRGGLADDVRAATRAVMDDGYVDLWEESFTW
jgi:hypothetical protein